MTGLSIQNLSMRFELPNGGAVQALQDVSLDLKEGELLSVLGPSGPWTSWPFMTSLPSVGARKPATMF
ncbi:MAG: hypothetical protein AAGK28_14505, partial [Pseudomonadota bacterium]